MKILKSVIFCSLTAIFSITVFSSIFLNINADQASAERFVVNSEAVNCSAQEEEEKRSKTLLGLPVWYKYLSFKRTIVIYQEGDTSQSDCAPSIDTVEDSVAIGFAVLEIMMTLAGLVAVVMIFWGSFNFVLSEGQSDKAASARKTVINAAIGLGIIVIATSVVSFIARTLTG